jgi:thiamine kinase-like enzyme
VPNYYQETYAAVMHGRPLTRVQLTRKLLVMAKYADDWKAIAATLKEQSDHSQRQVDRLLETAKKQDEAMKAMANMLGLPGHGDAAPDTVH